MEFPLHAFDYIGVSGFPFVPLGNLRFDVFQCSLVAGVEIHRFLPPFVSFAFQRPSMLNHSAIGVIFRVVLIDLVLVAFFKLVRFPRQ